MDISTYLSSFQSRREVSLDPFRRFLARIHNPHLSLPPIIHVAGTNGKGSTVAMLRAILEAAGYTVHAFTSPHLRSVTERFIIQSHELSEACLQGVFHDLFALAKEADLSWFEVLTGAFFYVASQRSADIVLLETGLGGEFDPTNVIPQPLMTILTPISFDHADVLGPQMTDIATAKAGIIKPHTTVVSHPQTQEVQHVLDQRVLDQHAHMRYVTTMPQPPYPCNLLGEHQQKNASVVIAALEGLKDQFPVSPSQIHQGLQHIQWTGRLELVHDTDAQKIYIDVAHNRGAMQTVATFMRTRKGTKAAVVALPKGKALQQTLEPLLGVFDHIYCLVCDQSGFHCAYDVQAFFLDHQQEASLIQLPSRPLPFQEVLLVGSHRVVWLWRHLIGVTT